MDKKIIALYTLIGILILTLVFFTMFPGMIYAVKDSGETNEDICEPEQGYTEESWKEHMGHHPNIYKECLT